MVFRRILVSGAALVALQAAPIYTVTNLGTLGGSSSTAYAINNNGVTVGAAANSGEYDRAYTASANIKELTAEGVFTSNARGINSSDAVIGTTYTLSGAQATLWNGGLFQNLGTLGGNESYGNALNDSGTAVGGAITGAGQLHAFQYTGGFMLDLGTLPGGTWSAAYAINNSGVIAGTSDTSNYSFRAVKWDARGIHSLGTLGGSQSYAFGINDAGQVVGSSTVASGYLHGFLTTLTGGMIDLGTLGGTSSYAYSINTGGDVVGYSHTSSDAGSHAFLWRGGILYDLNLLISPAAGWVLNDAFGINDSGQIVGTGTYNGQSRAFRLDPSPPVFSGTVNADGPTGVPEPATACSVITSGAVIVFLVLRRK